MELNPITKKNIKEHRKYLAEEIPNWQAFFEAIPVRDRGIVAGDFYNFRDELFGDFLYSLQYLPDALFANSSIVEIVIPENVKQIGSRCFYNCKDLYDCEILSDIKEIPMQCFSKCSSLKRLVLPKTVEKIGINAFQECNNDVQIISEKTGRNIQTTESQIAFLKDHFKEA